MTVTAPYKIISVRHGNLVVLGKTVLRGVPDNVVLTPGTAAGLPDGAFVGATASESKNRHVFPIGILEGLRFVCCFRFKLWWMTQRMGFCGKDVPLETQFMLVESDTGEMGSGDAERRTVYTVFLPLLEGPFRAVLQGNHENEIEICFESGDKSVETTKGFYMVYVHAGTNPFEVINQAVKAVEKHTRTFLHREKKKLPFFLDWFGWCTWDAFYTDVTAEGVEEGLKSLSKGGAPPRFLIIDDGWQQIANEAKDTASLVEEGTQFASRLTGIRENSKFQKRGKDGQSPGLKHVVEEAKMRQDVKYVYVWHALAGYWGGVKHTATGMEHYDSAVAYPVQSPGVLGNQPDIVMDSLTTHGLGLVHPKNVYSFYNEMHSYLASCGVDGVKVDVQNIIETLGSGHGGRVVLTQCYLQALEASILRNFPDNGCISCMCHNTDGLYSAKQTAVIRASDDFYPRDPASHTIHISSVAYNTLFLGEFMQPDWDMFHSQHPAADYHAAARAIGGCAIYVSDKPGNHNFDLLKKLVLPDGSVLRAQLPGRPTRDCLFADPARDGTSLLKVWNLNKCSGVVGVFNCQGAGWCRVEKKTRTHDASPNILTSSLRALDVDSISQIAGPEWDGETMVYCYRSGELIRLPKGVAVAVTLKVLEYEIFHFSPLKKMGPNLSFAAIGLLDMFNTGGAVEQQEIITVASAPALCRRYEGEISSIGTTSFKEDTRHSVGRVVLRVRGCGRFGTSEPILRVSHSNAFWTALTRNSGMIRVAAWSLF